MRSCSDNIPSVITRPRWTSQTPPFYHRPSRGYLENSGAVYRSRLPRLSGWYTPENDRRGDEGVHAEDQGRGDGRVHVEDDGRGNESVLLECSAESDEEGAERKGTG